MPTTFRRDTKELPGGAEDICRHAQALPATIDDSSSLHLPEAHSRPPSQMTRRSPVVRLPVSAGLAAVLCCLVAVAASADGDEMLPPSNLSAATVSEPALEDDTLIASRRLQDETESEKKEKEPRVEGELMIKAIQASGDDLGFIKCMKAEIWPDDPASKNFMQDVAFVFDDIHHVWRWVRSSPLMDTTPDGHLPMSISIREGAPDKRGYISRAARVFSGEEEINVIAWKFKGKGEDSFLDPSSEFNFELCPPRRHMQAEDKRPTGVTVRDCALLAVERGVVYDNNGRTMTEPTPKTKAQKAQKIKPNDPAVYKKLQEFLKKNRKRNGKVDVDKIIVEDATWKTKAAKFLCLGLMIPFGIWLYKKKKDFDLRSEKII